MKRQSTEWKKVFENHISNKGLIAKIYINNSYNSIVKKKSNFKMSRRSKQTFFQRRHTDGQQTRKKIINITHHQGTANQNHMRHHLTLVRMAIFKKKGCQGCGKKGARVQCWWECKPVQPQQKKAQKRGSSKLKIELLYDPTIPLLGIYQKKMKTLI